LVLTAAHVISLDQADLKENKGKEPLVYCEDEKAGYAVIVMLFGGANRWMWPCCGRVNLKDTEACGGTGYFASIAMRPVCRLSYSELDKVGFATIEAFDHGGSGAPLYEKGKLLGMALGFVRKASRVLSSCQRP
jgi:hypothetical protein